MTRAIHQFVAGFHRGDAISNEAVVLRRLFRAWGCASEIYCETRRVMAELRGEVRDVLTAPGACRPEDVVLLHLSTGSAVNDVFRSLACRRVLLYHNISPPGFFRFFQPATALLLTRGLEQVGALAGAAQVNLADSRFNAAELEAQDYPAVKVLPLLLDFEALGAPPDGAMLRRFRDGLKNVLFVGRCAPNKKIEDILTAFAFFQRTVEPASRLILAGSHGGMERYHAYLKTRVGKLELRNVVFTGSVPQAQINACYRAADLFLCLSEHEGFGIPLMESMFFDVPVLAYAAAAVPETLGGAGVLAGAKEYPVIAETMGELIRNTSLRAAVLARQRRRLAEFRARDLDAELRGHLAPLLQA